MRRHLILVALIVGLAQPAHAAGICADGATAPFAADNSPTLNFTVTNQTTRKVILGIHDRSEAATIQSVVGANCTWTERLAPASSANTTARLTLYEGANCDTGAQSVEVTFAASATPNSALSAMTCYTDTGGATLDFVSAGTTVDEANNDTSKSSPSVTFTAAGVLAGALATNNTTDISTVDTSNTTDVTNSAATRLHLLYRAESTSSHQIDVTISTNSLGLFAGLLYQENTGAPSEDPASGNRRLMLGVGDRQQ